MFATKSTLFAFVLMAFLFQATLPAQTASLTGSWQFTATPSTVSPVVSGLATFTSDGSMIETDTSQLATFASPGHGIWQSDPIPGRFYIQFFNLVANANGSLNSKKTVTMTVTPNSTGKEFTGGYSFEIVNAAGKVLSTGSGTVSGTLIPHPLLP